MKVTVAGPTGVYGRAVIPLLLQAGYEVRALARSTEKARRLFPKDIEIVQCDLLAADVGEVIESCLRGCDALMHIATAIPADASAPDAWVANARLRTDAVRLLLGASLKAGVRQYIQQSITMTYPDGGDEWITEDTPLDQSPSRGTVGSPVIQMEAMVRATPPDQLQWSILRGASFVGPDTFQERLIASLRDGQAAVPCDGRNFISLIHVEDMASATVAALKHAPPASIFNVTDEPLRQGEYYDRLAAAVGAETPRRDEQADCPPSWRCSNAQAKSILHWQPTHGVVLG